MNEKEKAAADYLLGKIVEATPTDACRFADALQGVMRAVLSRREAEAMGKGAGVAAKSL